MWIEALTPTGSVLHAGNLDRQKKDGYWTWIPVACHAGMSKRYDPERRFLVLGRTSPLHCKDCVRIVRKEHEAITIGDT